MYRKIGILTLIFSAPPGSVKGGELWEPGTPKPKNPVILCTVLTESLLVQSEDLSDDLLVGDTG